MADNRFAQYGPPTTNRFAPPALPYEGPQAAANLQHTQQEVQQTAATMHANEVKANNEAISSGIKAKSDQIDLDAKMGNAPGDTSLSGDAYLKSLPPGIRDTVQAIADNRYPSPLNPRNPQQIQIINAVNHYRPGFDAALYNTRLAAIKNGAVGKLGSSDNALNTAILHAGMLYDQSTGTKSQPGPAGHDFGVGPLSLGANALENWWHKGSPGQVTYNDTAGKLAGEEAQAYGMGTQGERDNLLQHFDPNLPLGSKLASIKNAMDLFTGKIAANLHQFQWGNMGNSKPSLDLLNPDARATLERIAPEALDKYFSRTPDPMAKALGVSSVSGGNQSPPGNGGSGGNTPPRGPDYSTMTPSDTGLGMAPASGGVKTQYDPQTSALVNGYLRKGMSYTDAMNQLKTDAPGANLAGLTTPTQWNAALKYAQQPGHENVNLVAATKQVPMSMGEQIFNPIAQNPGGAFAGHYYNNLFLGLPDKLAGKDQSAAFNALSDQQNPWSSFAGDALGMAGGASLMGKGVGAVADAGAELPVIGRYLRSIGLNPAPGLTGEEARMAQTAAAIRRNITGDQISAGITGANNNPDHPLIGAAANMAAMGAGNLVGRAVVGPSLAWLGDTAPGQAVINGARSLGAMVKKQFGGVPATPFSPPPAPDISLSRTTQNALPDITAKMQQAQSAGLPYMIADADPRLRAMLGSATRFSPNVQASAESILQPRQLGQGERAIGQINSNLAPVGDVPTMQANLLKSAQSQSAPLYDAAKAQPVPELTANPGLAEVLDRPAGQAAIRKGWERALNNGEDVGTLTYATDPSGNTVQYGNPSWNVIHYARQALDANGDTSVRQALDKQIAGLNPGFKAADAAYAGTMKGSDALQAGSEATETKVTPEATQQALAGFPNNGPQFQQGYASNMADMIGRQRMSGNPYDLVNGSMFQKEKLGTVFPQGADAFNTAQSLEGDMGKTYQSVLGGSPTQPRALDDKRFGLSLGDLADGGVDAGVAAMTGNPASLGMLFLRKGIDAAKFGMNAQKADAIAPFLMNPDPGANLAALSTWAQQNAARKAYLKQVNNMGMRLGAGALGAPAISWASQN